MMFFRRPLAALDIGASAIKLVELSGSGQRRLTRFGLEALPHGAFVDGQIVDSKTVTEHLRQLLKRSSILKSNTRLALSLSGSSIMVKKIDMTLSGDMTFHEQVHYQAEQAFQHDLMDLYYDAVMLGPARPTDRQIPALLVGARREVVESYVSMTRSLGLRVGVIECGPVSIANMFEYNYGVADALVALINVGASSSYVVMLEKGMLTFARDIPMGGDAYTRKLMEALGVNFQTAENLKISIADGKSPVPNEVQRVVTDLNTQLVSEVQHTVSYYLQNRLETDAQRPLSLVFLTGGGSRVMGFDATLASTLQVPAQMMNPFKRVEIARRSVPVEELMHLGSFFGVSVGLGLRSFQDREVA